MKTFKINDYTLNLTHKDDSKPILKINSQNFADLMRKEMDGELNKDKEEQEVNKEEKNQKSNNKRDNDDYFKRALKYNGEDYFEGNQNEIYDIEEQKRILKEFEKKDKQKRKEKEKENNKFILDDETVNENRTIINNIYNIFDDEFDNSNNNDFLHFNNDNQINNNYYNNIDNQGNNNQFFGQMNDDNNKANNQFEKNQNVISNINFDLDDIYLNYNNFNNPNKENKQKLLNNNNFNDDYNFFD